MDKSYSGIVFSIKDSIASVLGLSKVTSGEMVVDVYNNIGLVLNLEQSWTGVVMFDDNVVMSGDRLFRLFTVLSISSDPSMLSNVFNPIGVALSGDHKLQNLYLDDLFEEFGAVIRGVELKAPGIISRQPVYEPLFTGYIGVDGILPLGQGQRELIIGDKQTGKTAIAIDTILNQSNMNVILDKYLFKKRKNDIE